MAAWMLPAAMVVSSLMNAWGSNKAARTSAAVPRDLGPLRGQTLDLLSGLLRPGAFGAGGMGSTMFGLSSGPSPEMQTFDTVRPMLEAMMTGSGPQFERDIAMGNQSGGRFSSANAIMRGEAYRNLYNQRNQTAQTLGILSQGAGGAQRGAEQFRANLLAGLLGLGGQATLSLPVTQQPNALQNFGQAGMDISQLLMMLQAMRGGNANTGPATTVARTPIPGVWNPTIGTGL